MAKLFFRDGQKLAEETYQVAGILTGTADPVFWQGNSREIDFFDIKGLLNSIFQYLDLNDISYKKTEES